MNSRSNQEKKKSVHKISLKVAAQSHGVVRSAMTGVWCETVKLLRSHGGGEAAAISDGLVLDLNTRSEYEE